MAAAPVLELRGITKQFPGVRALDGVSFPIHAGEVHMLLGENGAGKSSLMKVLYGAYRADAGEFLHHGRPVTIASPADARRLGVAVIFQEFSLVPYLDIAQNVFLGREPMMFGRLTKRGDTSPRAPLSRAPRNSFFLGLLGGFAGHIDRARMHAEARRLLDVLGLELDTRTPLHRLGVAQQQLVEIAKALSQDARVLVMDEPTAALSDRETERLFAVIRRLKREGVAIVYISHRLGEVFELGDRITVLRDGRKVASLAPAETTPEELVHMMVGRAVDTTYAREYCKEPGEIALEVKGLAADSGLRDINLEIRVGEIVGLAGLVGAGRTELARAIFGADRVSEGEVRVFGASLGGGPDVSARSGVALIPESRKQEGLALIRPVQDNLLSASLSRLFPRGLFRPAIGRRVADEMIGRLHIATPSPLRLVRYLSGGNQQKVVIGKWLSASCRLFIFDEPTRGIDVGAKAEIFSLIDDLVKNGGAVLMISSEMSEIVHVCDRAYVMREGRIAGHLARGELTETNILKLAIHHA